MTLADDDVERILSAAETIERSLGVLAEKQSMGREAYRADRETQDVVERRFVKATEAALDIAETLVVHERGVRPDSNPGTMRALAEVGILNDGTAESMAQTARFRNVLAHTYGDVIDHDVVYDELQDLTRYRDFLVEVRSRCRGVAERALSERAQRAEISCSATASGSRAFSERERKTRL